MVALAAIVGILLAVIFMIYAGVPFLIWLFDALWVLLVFVVGIVARVVFRRPWTIEAASSDRRATYGVVGLRRSARALAYVANAIRISGQPPATIPPEPPRV